MSWNVFNEIIDFSGHFTFTPWHQMCSEIMVFSNVRYRIRKWCEIKKIDTLDFSLFWLFVHIKKMSRLYEFLIVRYRICFWCEIKELKYLFFSNIWFHNVRYESSFRCETTVLSSSFRVFKTTTYSTSLVVWSGDKGFHTEPCVGRKILFVCNWGGSSLVAQTSGIMVRTLSEQGSKAQILLQEK